jgi:hypothetical protein
MYSQVPAESDLQQATYAALESADSSVKSASLVMSFYHESQIAQVNMHLTCNFQEFCSSFITLMPPAIPSSLSPYLPENQVLATLKIANATSYAVDGMGLNASYSSANGEMSMNAWLLSNVTQLNNDVISILPSLAPPNSSYLQDLYDSYLNTTYSTVNSSTTRFDMVNGTMTFNSTETIQGNYEAELNREKSIYIDEINDEINATAQGATLPWELRLLNQTDINIDNLQAQFGAGQDWVYASFSGLILQPPQDVVNVISFRLKSWFNATTDVTAPPSENEELSVTVTGESSGNETVLLSAPPDVPAPDQMLGDNTTMTWNNVSMSSLQDLTFLTAFNQPINYQRGIYNVPVLTNSTVTDFVFNPDAMQVSFNVSGPSGTTGFCNVTVPRDLLNANATTDWTVILDGNSLTPNEFSITESDQYVFIYLNYTHSDHQVIIRGTQVLSEFQPSVLPIIFATLLALISAAAIKRRKKISLAVARYRSANTHI